MADEAGSADELEELKRARFCCLDCLQDFHCGNCVCCCQEGDQY